MNFAQKSRPLTPESQTWRVFQRKAHLGRASRACPPAGRLKGGNKLIHARKEQQGAVKIVFLVLCENLLKTFPSLPNKNLLCLAILQ